MLGARGRVIQSARVGTQRSGGSTVQPAAKFSALKLGAHVDGQVDAGVYRLSADSLASLKGSRPKVDRIDAVPGGAPVLVLLHGMFSETHATFGKLWHLHPQRVRELFAR